MEDLQKEFVPYDRALKMKDIGFDEPCFATYHYPSKSLVRVDADSQGVKNSNLVNFTSAPTFSQAFRFFREKYDLFSYPYVNEYQKFGYRIMERKEPENEELFYDWGTKDTYEEAELACLDKLIELTFKSE